LKVATSSELVQFSMSGVVKRLDYVPISAIILSEMSVHRRVIGQIACAARRQYVKVQSHEET